MSLTFSSHKTRRVLASLSGAVALLVVAPVAAQAACPSSPTANTFAQFGDNAAYSLAPGGSFEAGAPGWELSNAAVVEGNDRYTQGSHSLAIESNGVATSPAVCVSVEYPTYRFFVRRLGGNGPLSSLNASLRWTTPAGLTVETQAGSVHSGGAWTPSPVMRLGNSLPLWLPGSTPQVKLVFRSSWGGAWAIDDVSLDPYRR